MNFQDVIADKRDGKVNSADQLKSLADGAADGSIPDYQLSAWLMAAYVNGLNKQETADLTLAMAHSGERLDLGGLPRPWLDKHSTGGVGDKTTLVVLPILASCGVTMVKMSGRGLGITGGTIDKLESIPGFRTDLSPEEMIGQAKRIGIALSGQTPRLAPADKALYALRDVTGTVASVPLITASILSKKIAGGAETVVLDVKCGSGAFMKTLPEAETLATSLVEIGKLCGLNISAVITDMDQPLGMAVGNATEVWEAWTVLSTSADRLAKTTLRFRELCVDLAGHALAAVGLGDIETARNALESQKASAKFQEWVRAQGGTFPEDEPRSEFSLTVEHSGGQGWIQKIDAQAVGEVALELGAGRIEKDDPIDVTAGVNLGVCVGQQIWQGDTLFILKSSKTGDLAPHSERLKSAVEISDKPVVPTDPVLKIVS